MPTQSLPVKHPDAPLRLPIAWQEESFYDQQALDKELQRVFDICFTCQRCVTLCESFPLLFDAVEDSDSGAVEDITPHQTKSVVDACTLCDLCFATKCPYVPPHDLQVDFPHLMLRFRAVAHKNGTGANIIARELVNTDRNGKIASGIAGIANWASKMPNTITRPMLEKVLGVDQRAYLPPYTSQTLITRAKRANVSTKRAINSIHVTQQTKNARKVVIYATCFANFNNPNIGMAAIEVLHRNGVQTQLLYPECCGMPQFEHGDVANVARRAEKIAQFFLPWIMQGYDVVSLTPSCSLMLKFTWPLIVQTSAVIKLSLATKDITEYLLTIAKTDGLADGLQPLQGGITLHMACHSRAQHMKENALSLLQYLPDTNINLIERCSGHGGSWGVMKKNFTTALKIGKPVARTARKHANAYVVSECALAREHLVQGMNIFDKERSSTNAQVSVQNNFQHPVELIAHSYALGDST